MSKLAHIPQPCITELEDKTYWVKIFVDAPAELVMHREERNVYQTNRDIKIWSVYFLLKRISPESSKISSWRSQKEVILPFVQMEEKSFYTYLNRLAERGLATVDPSGNITLTSYEKAAELLGVPCELYSVPFNPVQHAKKQTFQYIIRAEELRHRKEKQLEALTYHLDKNPSLKNDMHTLLVNAGADGQRLQKEPAYFQERLLLLQMRLFKEGSDILDYVFTRRADINRGVRLMQRDHCYRSKQSVSYMKQRMHKLGLIEVEKKRVESKVRSRLYYTEGESRRDGYKYNHHTKQTVWFLTDQISFKYEVPRKKTEAPRSQKAA